MIIQIERLQERNLEIKRQYENLVSEKNLLAKRLSNTTNKRKIKVFRKRLDKSEKELFRLKVYRAQLKSVISCLIALTAEYYEKIDDTDKLSVYRHHCRFMIDDITKIKGYELLLKYGWYHPRYNSNGCVKDHQFSIKEGFDRGIDPFIIGHPANCEFLLNSDNCSKGKLCSVAFKILIDNISKW